MVEVQGIKFILELFLIDPSAKACEKCHDLLLNNNNILEFYSDLPIKNSTSVNIQEWGLFCLGRINKNLPGANVFLLLSKDDEDIKDFRRDS